MTRKLTIAATAMLALLGAASLSHAQVAGGTVMGVSVDANVALATGVSAKKAILGQDVYNDNKEKIGAVDDLIITPADSVSFAILGVGGFLGMGEHSVAIPVAQFKMVDGKITLPGATKDALKALPQFKYAK